MYLLLSAIEKDESDEQKEKIVTGTIVLNLTKLVMTFTLCVCSLCFAN